MDQSNEEDHTQLSQFQFLKKAIQILLSVSLFSFLISYYSPLPFLLESFNHHFTALPIELFTYTIHRNYIFLICNGILVFLIMKSGLITNPEVGSDANGRHIANSGRNQISLPGLSAPKALVNEIVVMEDQGSEKGISVTARADDQNGVLTAQDGDEDEDEDEDEGEAKFHAMEEEEEGIGLCSAEELNKKCDDFIKKMRGIKIEVQQLIMV